jgi:hypothetical protein
LQQDAWRQGDDAGAPIIQSEQDEGPPKEASSKLLPLAYRKRIFHRYEKRIR